MIPPSQYNLSVNKYFELFKGYIIAMGDKLDDEDIKIKFIGGLTDSNIKITLKYVLQQHNLASLVTHLSTLENNPNLNG